ncbi:MAG: hypothetical protein AAGD11_13865 [Planctomycetota bacterium]
MIQNLLCLVVAIGSLANWNSPAGQIRPLPANLAETLDLYLSSDAGYKSGDLITRSNIAEFQLYLRRTHGHSVATHSRWTERMLKDRDTLAYSFYNGGADLLRRAEKETAGYEEIHRIGRTALGRRALKQAIASKSIQPILDVIAETSKKQVSGNGRQEQENRTGRRGHLYTAADYVAAVEKFHAAAKSENQPADSGEDAANGNPSVQ